MNNSLLEAYYQYVSYGAFITLLTSITIATLNIFDNRVSYCSSLLALCFILLSAFHIIHSIIFKTTFGKRQVANLVNNNTFLTGFCCLIISGLLIIFSTWVELYCNFPLVAMISGIPISLMLIKYLYKIKAIFEDCRML